MTEAFQLVEEKRSETIPYKILNKHAPISSIQLELTGNKTIHSNVILYECRNLYHVKNIDDLLHETASIQKALNSTGCFNSVKTQLDTNNKGVVLKLHVQESQRTLSIGTSVNQKGHGALDVSMRAPCLLQKYHSMLIDGKISGSRSREIFVKYLMPHATNVFGYRWDTAINLSTNENDNLASSSFTEQSKGAEFRITEAYNARHQIGFGCYIRDINPLTSSQQSTSLGVLCSPSKSIKNCFKYGFSHPFEYKKQRDPNLTLFHGNIQGLLEIAALGYTTYFTKFEGLFTNSFYLGYNFTIHTQASAGVLCRPLWNFLQSKFQFLSYQKNPIHPIQDRFFLGGPSGASLILNGFGARQIGPVWPRRTNFYSQSPVLSYVNTINDKSKKNRAQNGQMYDYLGGTAYTNGYISLSKTLNIFNGFIQPSIFVFANAGTVTNPSTFSQMFEKFRVATGLGCSLPIGMDGTLEFVVSKPLKSYLTDVVDPFQVGFRLRNLGW